jgi:hypothetical protein
LGREREGEGEGEGEREGKEEDEEEGEGVRREMVMAELGHDSHARQDLDVVGDSGKECREHVRFQNVE